MGGNFINIGCVIFGMKRLGEIYLEFKLDEFSRRANQSFYKGK